MSIILDALQKAQRERARGQEPRKAMVGSATAVAPHMTPKLYYSVTGMGAALVALAFLVGYLSGPRMSAPPEPTVQIAATTPMPTPIPAPVPLVADASPAPPVAPPGPVAVEVATAPVAPRTAPYTIRGGEGVPSLNPAPVPPVTIIVTHPAQVAAAAPKPITGPDEVPPPSRPVATAPDLPFLQDLPGPIRAEIPPLRVSIHVYDPDRSRRFTVINGVRYQEQNQIDGGIELEEITGDGLILRHRGTRFKLGRS